MVDVQLKFRISNKSLYRLEHYVPTEGSEEYVHASFEVADDENIPNAVLAVYARYGDKIYTIPKNVKTGCYDLEPPYLQYPGFHIQCQIFNSEVVRNTEELFIKVAGNGNVLKRFLKAPDEYSIELLTRAYNQSMKNVSDIKSLNDLLNGLFGKSAVEIYNKLNGTSLTEEDFIKVISKNNNIFSSMEEALKYLNSSECVSGSTCSVLEDGKYNIYVVQPEDGEWKLLPISTESGDKDEVYILEEGESRDNIPDSAKLIIIPDGNDTEGYVTIEMLNDAIGRALEGSY